MHTEAKQAAYSKEEILAKLEYRNAVERAIVAIYHRQTASEKSAETTTDANGKGFSAFDAKKGTDYAKWVLSGKRLSGYHFFNAQRMARKYVKQLLEIASTKPKPPQKLTPMVATKVDPVPEFDPNLEVWG